MDAPRFIIRPLADASCEIDATGPVVRALAYELWKRFGGNAMVNWIEAEWQLERVLGDQKTSRSRRNRRQPAPTRPRRRGRARRAAFHRKEKS